MNAAYTDQQIEVFATAIHALSCSPIIGLQDRLDLVEDTPVGVQFWEWSTIVENTRACIRNMPHHRAPKGNYYQRIADRVVELRAGVCL